MATGNSAALFYLDPGAFGGSVKATTTGFEWTLVGVYREVQTNRKEVIAGITVTTLDADSLTQIRDKLAAAVKAEGTARDFNVTAVVFFPLSTVAV
jgi:hypothetical protein